MANFDILNCDNWWSIATWSGYDRDRPFEINEAEKQLNLILESLSASQKQKAINRMVRLLGKELEAESHVLKTAPENRDEFGRGLFESMWVPARIIQKVLDCEHGDTDILNCVNYALSRGNDDWRECCIAKLPKWVLPHLNYPVCLHLPGMLDTVKTGDRVAIDDPIDGRIYSVISVNLDTERIVVDESPNPRESTRFAGLSVARYLSFPAYRCSSIREKHNVNKM